MSCDVGKVMERLENELCYDYNYELYSFSNLSVTSPTSQLILQPFHPFTYITAHSPTLPLLHLRHSSFSNPSNVLPTTQLILQPFFRFSYVTGSSLTLPREPPMPVWTRRSEKYLHSSDTRDRTRTIQLIAKRFAA